MVGRLGEGFDEFASGTEDLHLVVFSGTNHDPGVVLVPVETRDAIGEATVHEETIDCQHIDCHLVFKGGGHTARADRPRLHRESVPRLL